MTNIGFATQKAREAAEFCSDTGFPYKNLGIKHKSTVVGGFRDKIKRLGRNQNPIVPGVADLVNWFYYDTAVTIAAGAATAAQYMFYTTPIGGTKTKTQTNMEQVSRLPDPYVFNATHLGLYFGSNMNKLDIDLLLANGYIEFRVGDKVYAEGPMQFFPGGAGLTGSGNIASTSAWVNGQPQLGNMFDMRLPGGLQLGGGNTTDGNTGISILQGQTFKVTLYFPTQPTMTASGGGGVGASITCNLYGQLSRTSQ